MILTEQQIKWAISFAVLFIFYVGLLYILRSIFRTIKRAIRNLKLKVKKIQMKRKLKKQQGFLNYKGNIWYPSGQVWNTKKKTFEKADYNTKE